MPQQGRKGARKVEMDAGSTTAAGGQVYRLRVVLAGISPLIWRQLEVAGSTTLAELHRILQTAFGWSGEHLHCIHRAWRRLSRLPRPGAA
jgi:hypothetical protein